MAALIKRGLFRVTYNLVGENGELPVRWSTLGSLRKHVVARDAHEAIDNILQHEAALSPSKRVVVSEVTREQMDVWV